MCDSGVISEKEIICLSLLGAKGLSLLPVGWYLYVLFISLTPIYLT